MRKLIDFEDFENVVMKAAIFMSKWHHNYLIKYAKIK